MSGREEMSTSFGAMAGAYEQGRPEYPAEAVAWMLRPVASHQRALRVADVGAGTGKLTRALVPTGAQIVAIDPDPKMLQALRTAVPGVPTFVGSAETLPIPDAALDAVVFGQAWHWVDAAAASIEVGRVLRAGGVLGLVWNIRDESVDWISRMSQIMHGSAAERMLAAGPPPVGPPFADVESYTLAWERPMTRDGLFALVHSRSYVITADDAERSRIDAELGSLLDEIGAVGEARIPVPYVTRAFRAVRP